MRLLAWMAERFPAPNVIAAVLVWAAALLWGRALSTPGPVVLHARDAAGGVASVAFFLMLRVFDEHKDYAADCVAHPNRVLQRGIITLRDLKIVGLIAIAVQVAASIVADDGFGVVTITWIVAFAWSILMAKEFFASDWLRPQLVLYAITHMVVMPLMVTWLMRMGAQGRELPAAAWALPAASYLTGFAFEIARKLKAPADERPGVDSYTRALGTWRAPIVLGIVLTFAAAAFLVMFDVAAGGITAIVADVVLAATIAVAWRAILFFRSNPAASNAKGCEKAAGLVIGVSHLLLVTLVAASRGVRVG